MSRSSARVVRRVLLVLQSVAVGGMEGQGEELAREFGRLGVRVAVVVPSGAVFDALTERLVAADVRIERADSDARRGRVAQALAIIRLIAFMRRWRPDVVHLHTGGPTGGIALLLAARLFTHAAVIVTEHNVPFDDPGMRLRLATRVKDRLVHAVVALSARNAALRRTWLGAPRNFAGIPPGIRFDAVEPERRAANRTAVRRSLAIARSAVVITSVSRLAADKGMEDLVRAFAAVTRDEACDLLLVGEGPLRTHLEALAADLGIAATCHFVGHHREPGQFLDASDLFALASPRGSGSVALLEAMARGLPAVITYCGPGEFLVAGYTGACAPPSDPSALARVLLELVRDPARRATLGANGATRARDRFRIEEVARDLLEVYASAKDGAIAVRLGAARLDAW